MSYLSREQRQGGNNNVNGDLILMSDETTNDDGLNKKSIQSKGKIRVFNMNVLTAMRECKDEFADQLFSQTAPP